MLFIDPRLGSRELLSPLRGKGLVCELADPELPYGDVCFEGYGPDGVMTVGIEHKKLHDIMDCIEDHRYSAHQLVGMKKMYGESWLMIEGYWKPHSESAYLMEGFKSGTSWGMYRERGSGGRPTMYSKLYRYLISVRRAGVYLDCPKDREQSVQNIHEIYHYYQKKTHTSMVELQKAALPVLSGKPPLVRLWGNALTDVGAKYSLEAQGLFRTPIRLANSNEEEWLRIKGIGVSTSQQIIREIHGGRI